MLSLGSLAFLNPWVLAGLAALPILWWLLRTLPPSPRRISFAGIRLLLGLDERERQASRMPWWLLLLRMVAVALILLGFAQPVMNPGGRLAGDGPILLVVDNGWASAPDWDLRLSAAGEVLTEAEEARRQVILWPTADLTLETVENPVPVAAAEARQRLGALEPRPWPPQTEALAVALEEGALPAAETIWVHDGLGHETEISERAMAALAELGPLRILVPENPARALTPPWLAAEGLTVEVLRADPGASAEPLAVRVIALATDDDGTERRVGIAEGAFAPGEATATLVLDLPGELAARVTRLVLAEGASAGGAAVSDGSIRRPPVFVVAPDADQEEVSPLTSATFYLRQALQPWAEVRSGSLTDALDAQPVAIFLVDFGQIPQAVQEDLTAWVEAGGMLVRFSGPRLAAAVGGSFGGFSAVGASDPLLPVRLRRGGRALGGTLSTAAPKTLAPFPEATLFQGLTVPDEVDVSLQVLADPSPELAARTWASLADGTPLVTGKTLGEGRVILFHVSAEPEWSSLPLSGLFVEMLGRIIGLATGQGSDVADPEILLGTLWRADLLIAADGTPRPAGAETAPVDGALVAEGIVGPDLPPGIYLRAGAVDDTAGPSSISVNLFARGDALAPMPDAPAGVSVETLTGAESRAFGPMLIAAALALLVADLLATLLITGRLSSRGGKAAPVAALLIAMGLTLPAEAQELPTKSATETTFAYVITGDAKIDRISERGLVGLGRALARRTAVEPGPPIGIDPEKDELSFYPIIYWPLVGGTPSDETLERLAEYLRAGGMLIIDTQDGPTGLGGTADMRRIAEGLNLPPLEPIPDDHVLTRAFYLLDTFPGRWAGGRVWVEALPEDAGTGGADEALPHFKRVDDNVSPVIVGSADWAGAWAVDEEGYPMLPVGRRGVGDRQRELAMRFGINLAMYALTGNYKSDQVHAPAILERLGQ